MQRTTGSGQRAYSRDTTWTRQRAEAAVDRRPETPVDPRERLRQVTPRLPPHNICSAVEGAGGGGGGGGGGAAVRVSGSRPVSKWERAISVHGPNVTWAPTGQRRTVGIAFGRVRVAAGLKLEERLVDRRLRRRRRCARAQPVGIASSGCAEGLDLGADRCTQRTRRRCSIPLRRSIPLRALIPAQGAQSRLGRSIPLRALNPAQALSRYTQLRVGSGHRRRGTSVRT
jgi:hypothetical protein